MTTRLKGSKQVLPRRPRSPLDPVTREEIRAAIAEFRARGGDWARPDYTKRFKGSQKYSAYPYKNME